MMYIHKCFDDVLKFVHKTEREQTEDERKLEQ